MTKTHPAHVPTQAEATEAVRALFARHADVAQAARIATRWADAWVATGEYGVAVVFYEVRNQEVLLATTLH